MEDRRNLVVGRGQDRCLVGFPRQGWATDGLCTCGLVTRLPLYTMVTCCSNLRATAPMKYTAPLLPPFKRVAFLCNPPPFDNRINFTHPCAQMDPGAQRGQRRIPPCCSTPSIFFDSSFHRLDVRGINLSSSGYFMANNFYFLNYKFLFSRER